MSVWQDTKKCMLPTALGLPEDVSLCSVLALEVQGFSKGSLSPWSQSVLLNWVFYCTTEYSRKYELNMTSII